MANMETTVLAARNSLSALLRRVEQGEEVVIRRGRGPQAKAFRLIVVEPPRRRTLRADPRWKGKIAYKDEDIWASEWSGES